MDASAMDGFSEKACMRDASKFFWRKGSPAPLTDHRAVPPIGPLQRLRHFATTRERADLRPGSEAQGRRVPAISRRLESRRRVRQDIAWPASAPARLTALSAPGPGR